MQRFASALFISSLIVLASCSKDPPASGKPTGDGDGGDPTSPEGDGGDTDPTDGGADGQVKPPSKVNVTNEKITIDGRARDYVLAVPKTYAATKPYPLVFVFHGDGGDGPGMRAARPFDDTTGDDAIVVYPTGIGATWDLYTPWADNTDNHFIDELITALKAKYSIGNVFGDGYSNGGFFVNQLASRRPKMFRAIIAHAGGAPGDNNDPPLTSWPGEKYYYKDEGQNARPDDGVAALIVHGDKDTGVVWESGEFAAKYWSYVNTCGTSLTDTANPPCKQYDGCAAGKPVIWCLVPNLGHWVWDKADAIEWAFIKGF